MIKYLVTWHREGLEHARVSKSDAWLKSRNGWMLLTLGGGGGGCQRLMSEAFRKRCEKLKIWSGWLWWSFFPSDSAPSAWEEVQTPVCLVSAAQLGKKKKKKKVKWNIWRSEQTANLALRCQILISRRQLASVHREESASTLDSLIQLCDLRVCDMHQTLWLLPISTNVSVHVWCWRGIGHSAVGRVKNSNYS